MNLYFFMKNAKSWFSILTFCVVFGRILGKGSKMTYIKKSGGMK